MNRQLQIDSLLLAAHRLEHGAMLRSVSPPSTLTTQAERARLVREARNA